MNLATSSVDLEGITSSVSRSQFDESELEYLANLFLKSGDTVSPILLREKSPIAFEVLEGHREYYAALKAQEIDSRFESIRAYIVPSDREDSILEQYEYFHTSNTVAQPNSNSIDQKLLVSAIEQSIANQINPLKSSLQDVNTKLDQKVNFPQVSTSEVSITQLETTPKNIEQQLADLIKSVHNIEQRIIPPDSKILEDFNNLSSDAIRNKLKAAKVSSSLLNKLVESIVKGRPYSGSFTDFVKSDKKKLFTDKGWVKLLEIKILDLW